MSEDVLVKVPSAPFKRYWVVKVIDSPTKKEVFSIVSPLWCNTNNLQCQFSPSLIVSKRVQFLAERGKPADPDWLTFDYVFFTQTGNK